MLPNDSSALIGRTIAGKFVVESVIAVGGIGTVYRARQLALDRTVAIKVLHAEIAREEKFVERFKREARAASRLEHPNSVRVLDFGQEGDALLYLAMEYVEGRTLYDLIQTDWPLADWRVVDIMSQVLAAVGVAHDMEVIHRDLKPENIIIVRGKSDEGEHAEVAKVCDFGIATLGTMVREGEVARAAGPRVTTRGFIIGTPEYMSPEQVMGEAADRRSDLYAAGVMLYQMLAGRVPFEGQSPYGIAVRHITDAPYPPSAFATVNPALEAICLKAMSKAPEDRYDSAREMRAALRATITSGTAAVAPWSAPAQTRSLPVPAPASLDPVEATGVTRGSRFPVFVGLALAVVLIAALATKARLFGHPASPRAGTRTAGSVASSTPAGPEPAQPTTPTPPPPNRSPTPSPTPTSPSPSPSPSAPSAAPVAIAPHEHRTYEDRGGSAPSRRGGAAGPGTRATRSPASRLALQRGAPRPTSKAGSPEASQPIALSAPPDETPAPPTPAAPPAKAAATPVTLPRVDVDRAKVSITAVTTTSAVSGSNVRAAVGRVPFLGCYRGALRDHGTIASGTATLHLSLDDTGYIVAATLRDATFLPALKGCVERASRGLKIKNVDTGEASADITLSFVSSP